MDQDTVGQDNVDRNTVDGSAGHARTVLPAVAPFDFGASLRFIRGFPAMVGEQGASDDVLVQAVRANGVVVGARLSASDGGLACELESAGEITDKTVAVVADRVSFQLGLADDLGEFYALAEHDAPFAGIARRLRGYHQVKFPSPLELFCWALLCQRVPLPVARGMKQALVSHFDNKITVAGTAFAAFPDLEQLLSLDQDVLFGLIGNERKAGYLYRGLPRWADLDEAFLRTGDYDEVQAALQALPGVGPWSATFILIRGLGRMERMAPDREGLRAASKVYGHPVDEAEFTRLASHYGPWQGYWGHYLRVGG
ncbi:DNA-3-methyladenine glycosylase 2 family protein [Actinokineospora sp. NBRC 105648]|uniref:DNA-3-methyladenine glycosylase family protein n=1 Tax=Actinokineospora sp. NBRC 105648 TaxID=3032206 RepID=UPI0024A3B5CB|nr:DNA-3-methyladenine glycosylase 2 family protein [Actinokineospora sp. NBRC 105648]GLZ42196.1 DNA-3-methyladenine glycosylase 2 family protein [Actinokineospora sp. NBRC 105648]